jgi:hypothetical protein
LKYKSLCALCAFSAGFALNNLDKEIRVKAMLNFFYRRGNRGGAKDAEGSEENGLEIQISLRTLRNLSGLCVKKKTQ